MIELVGGCPLFVKRSIGSYFAVSRGPLTPYAGFLLPDQDSTSVRKSELVQHGILNALCDRIQRDRYSSITITNSPDLLDIRPCLWRGWEGHVAYTYYVNLEGNFSERFSKSVRREVRKAVDAGIYVEKLGDTAIHHKLLTQVFERQGLDAPVGENFFMSVLDIIKRQKCGCMWVARDEPGNQIYESINTPRDKVAVCGLHETSPVMPCNALASHIWIWDNKRAYAWSAASNQTCQDSGANQFLFPTSPELITSCAQTDCISIKIRNRMNSVDWHKGARYALHITRCKLIALISKDDWDLGGNNGAGRSDSLCIAGNPGYLSVF